MEWIRNWRLGRLQEKQDIAQARLASYDYIARQTGTHYPVSHELIYAELGRLKHRIERLTSTLPSAKSPQPS